MRTRIVLLCGIILVICLWLLWTTRRQIIEPQKQMTTTNAEIQRTQTQKVGTSQVSSVTNPSASVSQQITNLPRRGAQPPTPDEVYHMYDTWRTPIEFYGMVVDQSNNPVVDADITFDCNDLSEKGTSFYNRKSDQNGLFSLSGIRGEGITVHVSKKGYYTSKNDRVNFEYGQGGRYHFEPNFGNPIVFHLQRKTAGESLIHIAGTGLRSMRDYLLAADGQPTDVSLLDGRQTPTGQGDLQVEFQAGKPLDNFPSRITWQCQVSVPGGGLIPTTEEFPFLAPETGYVPTDEWSITTTNWTEEVQKQYYVKLRNGDFGRVTVRIIGVSSPFFRMESFVNPSGSRNLEPAN